MQINSINNFNVNSKYENNVSFSGRRKIIDFGENHISPRAIRLTKELSSVIAADWKNIRQSNNLMDSPRYLAADKSAVVSIRPLYQHLKNFILMEVNDEKFIDRIIIDRARPNDYKYERAKITPHGSATFKSFDATRERNFDIEHRVNNYIETYFPMVCNTLEDKLNKRRLGIF